MTSHKDRKERSLNCSGKDAQKLLTHLPVRERSARKLEKKSKSIGAKSKRLDTMNKSRAVASDSKLEKNKSSKNEKSWCDCVCLKRHGEHVPVFWIQCDNCRTWYNASSRCLEFGKEEAQYIDPWICRKCPKQYDAKESTQP